MNRFKTLLLAASLIGAAGIALAQYTVPQVQSIGPNDLFQDVVGGIPQANSYYASGAMLSGFFGAGSGQGDNFLIGGDFTTNLFQRGTSAITMGTGATVLYGADRWFGWEAVGGSTAFTTARSTTAASLPTGVKYSNLMALTNSQTGTAQVCMGQEVPSANAQYLAGHTVELDFNAYTGATLTATAVNAYVIYGTDAAGDNGSANMAFGLNANSGSSTAWAGQTNATTGALATAAVSTLYRGMAVATIPTTATEIGVALCFTPSGTSSGSGGTDGVYWSNISLRKADFLSAWANATTAYSVNTTSGLVTATINGAPGQNFVVPPFNKRSSMLEALLQYSFYYQVNEYATAGVAIGPGGYYVDTTHCQISFPLPAPMYKTPTIQNAAITNSTFTVAQSGGTPAAGAALAGSGNSGLILAVGSTPAAPFTLATASFITGAKTQYAGCQLLSTASGGGNFGFNSEL
jgi:hypothetical protein